MKTLEAKQIDSLFDFVKKHYVDYYDLQIELVDHLANDIEHIMSKQTNISFEEARDFAFKKFGVTGFYEVIKSKTSQMEKEYYRLIFKYLLSLFASKNIIWIAILLFGFSFIFKFSTYNMVFLFGFMIILFVVSFVLTYRKTKDIKRRIKSKEKVMIIDSLLASMGSIAIFISMLINLFSLIFRKEKEVFSPLLADYSILFAFLLILLVLFIYISIRKIPIEIALRHRDKYFTNIQ